MFGLGKTKEEREKERQEQKNLYTDIAMAQAELNELKKEYGIEDEKKGIAHAVSSMFERAANREPVAVRKKTYIIVAILTGWFGGHRFYTKHYKTGMLYLAFSWLGIGLYHTMLDIMQVIPMKPDENGMILL